MPSDQRAIQGLWRIVSCVSRGGPVNSATTHYQFDGNRVKAIDPSQVDGGKWATFELDPNAQPKRFTMTLEWDERGGKPVQRIDRWLYELDGDTLRLCWPCVFGDYPDALSDQTHGIETLIRDHGPPPNTKQPSGKEAIEDRSLGRLTWNDDLDWWETRIELKPGLTVDVRIQPENGQEDTKAVAVGRELVRWLRQNEEAARRFAAGELLDTHNDSWNDGEPISAEMFAGRLRLESVGLDPEGGANLDFHDGELFWGHSIVVYVDKDRDFKYADIEG